MFRDRHGRLTGLAVPMVLVALMTGTPVHGQPAPPPVSPPLSIELPPVDIVGQAPVGGPGLGRDRLPGQTTVLHRDEIERMGEANALRAIEQNVPGLTLEGASGNPSQPNISLHGFQVSPLQGTAQGLAVYVNGTRFNQPFGDTVNWDLIPEIAIDSINVTGANPAFGLNALGGAINVRMRNGFVWHGAEAVLSGGSFGRVLGQVQYGAQVDNVAAYAAGSVLRQNGWRDMQSSQVQNFFGDLGWRGPGAELHATVTAANSILNGPGTSPIQLLAADPRGQFTAPNYMANQYLLGAVQGHIDLTDTETVDVNAYYDHFHQHVMNGNVTQLVPCGGVLCLEQGVVATDLAGQPIPNFLSGGPYSQLDLQTTNTNGYGASVQVSGKRDVLGFKNTISAGLSFDGAQITFTGSSLVGGISDASRVFIGPGITIDQADGAIAPVRLLVTDAYAGAWIVDTMEPLPGLSVTASGRMNVARIDMRDQLGSTLSGTHIYSRFNPALGAAYEVKPWLILFGGYAETNRAPTPAELSCANPAAPCSLANFFVGDPNLKQVVARTFEAGARGRYKPADDVTVAYQVGLYYANVMDDILFVNSPIEGRGFFQNVGATRRAGVDLVMTVTTPRLMAYLNYSFTNATFQRSFVASSPNNPAANASGDITVFPGDRLPGVPANVVKFGAQYKLMDEWTAGVAGIATTGSWLFGDEANLTQKLPGYVRFDLNTSWWITPNIQLFGTIENVLGARYYTYGTFSPTASVAIAQAPGATNPRSYSPAAPFGAFAGVRVRF